MSGGSGVLTTEYDRFTRIIHLDTEYRTDGNGRPIPVTLYAQDHRTGEAWGPYYPEQLAAMRRAPFDTGPQSVVVAYSATAELNVFIELGWPPPTNVLC